MLIPIPNLRGARRLLCVQPHYDDNVTGLTWTQGADWTSCDVTDPVEDPTRGHPKRGLISSPGG